MGRKCCVPNCGKNATQTTKNGGIQIRRSIFRFPKDEELKNEWLQRISRKDVFNTEHAGVCILHFESYFIKPLEGFKKNRLRNDAIPTIFPFTPPSFTSIPVPTKVFSVRIKEIQNQQNTLNMNFRATANDDIRNFDDLRTHLTEKLKLDNWIVAPSGKNVYIFNLNKQICGNLTIRNTINIDSDLVVKVFVNNDVLKNTLTLDLTISQWSQLQNLLDNLKINVECRKDSGCQVDNVTVAGNIIKQEETDILCENIGASEFCSTKADGEVNLINFATSVRKDGYEVSFIDCNLIFIPYASERALLYTGET